MNRLSLIRPNGSGLRRVRKELKESFSFEPTWSPGGRRLAFVHATLTQMPHIRTLTRNGKRLRQVTHERKPDVRPDWGVPMKESMARTTRNLPALGALALVTASLVLGACGNDDEAEQAAATPNTLAIAANEAGNQSRLSVPRSVPAGLVSVELTNTGKVFHEAQLIRLDPGHTPDEALRVIAAEGAPSPAWIHAAGGTGPAPPHASTSATQRLRPGNYMVYDAPFLNEGQGVKFGVATFKVEGRAEKGELPKSTANVQAYEYGFRASGLKAGANTVKFTNAGSEPHHVIAVPYRPGATLAEVREAFKREQGGAEPPLDFENPSSTARIDGGTEQVTELNLERPGKYALLCFVSDRKGGPPHVAHGMIAEITAR